MSFTFLEDVWSSPSPTSDRQAGASRGVAPRNAHVPVGPVPPPHSRSAAQRPADRSAPPQNPNTFATRKPDVFRPQSQSQPKPHQTQPGPHQPSAQQLIPPNQHRQGNSLSLRVPTARQSQRSLENVYAANVFGANPALSMSYLKPETWMILFALFFSIICWFLYRIDKKLDHLVFLRMSGGIRFSDF